MPALSDGSRKSVLCWHWICLDFTSITLLCWSQSTKRVSTRHWLVLTSFSTNPDHLIIYSWKGSTRYITGLHDLCLALLIRNRSAEIKMGTAQQIAILVHSRPHTCARDPIYPVDIVETNMWMYNSTTNSMLLNGMYNVGAPIFQCDTADRLSSLLRLTFQSRAHYSLWPKGTENVQFGHICKYNGLLYVSLGVWFQVNSNFFKKNFCKNKFLQNLCWMMLPNWLWQDFLYVSSRNLSIYEQLYRHNVVLCHHGHEASKRVSCHPFMCMYQTSMSTAGWSCSLSCSHCNFDRHPVNRAHLWRL